MLGLSDIYLGSSAVSKNKFVLLRKTLTQRRRHESFVSGKGTVGILLLLCNVLLPARIDSQTYIPYEHHKNFETM